MSTQELVRAHLKGVKIIYPAVYNPKIVPGDDCAKYRLGFETENLNDTINLRDYGVHPREIQDTGVLIYNASSKFPPTVHFDNVNYEEIIKAFQIADVRNITRDLLLRNLTANIDITLLEYCVNGTFGKREGVMIGLNNVYVTNAEGVMDNVLNFKVGENYDDE